MLTKTEQHMPQTYMTEDGQRINESKLKDGWKTKQAENIIS